MIFNDHMKLFVNTLFSGFPREVGFPARRTVNSFEEFSSLAHSFHLSSPIFIQLYKVNEVISEVEIDKIWIDFDHSSQFLLMSEIKIVYERLLELGFNEKDIVIVFTGKKGFHIYAKLKPKIYEIDFAKDFLNWIISWLCKDLISPDEPLFSDINRIVRVSGAQRPEGTFAITLNPLLIFKYNTIHDFFIEHKLAWKKLTNIGSNYLKKMSNGTKMNLLEIKQKVKSNGFKPPNKYQSLKSVSLGSPYTVSPITKSRKGEYFDYLKKIMRNREHLFYAIHAPNPRAIDRVRFAILLLKSKLPIDNIVEIMESLGWIDYNKEITTYHVNYIKRKYNL